MPRRSTNTAAAKSAPTEEIDEHGILRMVLDSTAEGIVVADAQGKFLIFNPAAQQMVGIGPTDARPEEWSARYGCYELDGVTPMPMDRLPLTRAILEAAASFDPTPKDVFP